MSTDNSDMAAAWDGDDGDHWSRNRSRYDRSLAGYHEALLRAAAITPTDRVLDIGCGTGQTTRDAARAATGGTALGVDLSAQMLDRARELAVAEGVGNASFLQGDAQVHPFEPNKVEVAISRFGSMFFADPIAAFTNIGRAMVVGGRLSLVVWQEAGRQGWARAITQALDLDRGMLMPPPDARGPFALADPVRTSAILKSAGFVGVEVTPVEGDYWAGEDTADAFAFMRTMRTARRLLVGLDEADLATGLNRLRATIDTTAGDRGVVFESAAWLVTARRQPWGGKRR